MNAARLRELLTHTEDNPALLDTRTYAEARPYGIAADLAGRTLLLNGWTLAGDDAFLSPDGTREISRPADIEGEAQAVLGLTDDETWDNGDLDKAVRPPCGRGGKEAAGTGRAGEGGDRQWLSSSHSSPMA